MPPAAVTGAGSAEVHHVDYQAPLVREIGCYLVHSAALDARHFRAPVHRNLLAHRSSIVAG